MKKKLFFIIVLLLSIDSLSGDTDFDLDRYYAHLFSIGAEIQFFSSTKLSPFFDIIDFSGSFRHPLKSIPELQPYIQLGLMHYSQKLYIGSQFLEDHGFNASASLDHYQLYGGLGSVYLNKVTKNTELGMSLFSGISYGIYPKLVENTITSYNWMVELGGSLTLNPHYNFSLEFKPTVRYLHSLINPLTDFNGFLFSVGFNSHFRYGDDPDALNMTDKNIMLREVQVPPLFAAMHNYYSRNPAGRLTIQNNSPYALEEVEVDFFQKEFMNYPTPCKGIEFLAPDQGGQVDLYAVFNRRIFSLEGVTPLTGEVTIRYRMRGRRMEEKKNISFEIYDKRSLVWDDNRKIGAFITPSDSSVSDFMGFINRICRDYEKDGVNPYIQYAIQVYQGLTELGCIYQSDPIHPFIEINESSRFVDTVNLARNTLKKLSGDCDDLTVLYCTLLETLGVETGFIRIPGHILPAVNTGVSIDTADSFYKNSSLFFPSNGMYWLPVEVTLLGKDNSFMTAWYKGSELVLAAKDRYSFYSTREAQNLFRPVGLNEVDLPIILENRKELALAFDREMGKFFLENLSFYKKDSGQKEELNRLGNVYSGFGYYEEAADYYRAAIDLDETYLFPIVNLGNLAFCKEDYEDAVNIYLSILEREDTIVDLIRQDILLNLYISYCSLKKDDKAGEIFRELNKTAPEMIKEYSHLSSNGDENVRGISSSVISPIKFLGEGVSK